MSHDPDWGDYSVEEAPAVRETLESLVGDGKIRSYAWSTDHPASAAVFAEGENCTAVQHRLNVFEDAQDVIALCEAENLASINRNPPGNGSAHRQLRGRCRLRSR